jgi:CIC family chloride channel protein
MVFVFELTRDYEVVLPLMLATVVADLVYSAVNDDSLMTEKLRRRGVFVGRHYGVDPFSNSLVEAIMTSDVAVLPATATVGEARSRFAEGGHGAYPVVGGDGALVGIVTRGDVLRDECDDDEPLLRHASTDVVAVAPTERAQAALRVMVEERVEHVPVVAEGRLVGICTRTDLLKLRRRQLELEHPQAGLVTHTMGRLGRRR